MHGAQAQNAPQKAESIRFVFVNGSDTKGWVSPLELSGLRRSKLSSLRQTVLGSRHGHSADNSPELTSGSSLRPSPVGSGVTELALWHGY